VAIAFAKEGAASAIVYKDEHQDAEDTKKVVEQYGGTCVLLPGDIASEDFCREAVSRAVDSLGRLDVLVNNAAVQYPQDTILDIDADQLEETFRVNILAMFHLVKAALPHMAEGSAIINTTSVVAYRGHPILLDYAATKGAIVAFTRALALQLADREIRVNAVAPGPIWTPLVPASFGPEHTSKHGLNTALGRTGQPAEVAPSYVFLAGDSASYMTGQVLHPNGGLAVGG
jgi:NAD(P)-dependent dehydrogenase (short-subunit alcohol dehydrogenase family)